MERKREEFSISFDNVSDCLLIYDKKTGQNHTITVEALMKLLLNIELKEIEYDD